MTEVIETKPYPTPDEIAALAAEALDDVKGKDIVNLDTRELTSLFSRLVVCTGDSNRQVKALARNVQDKVREAGAEIISVEGEDTGEWVLVDIGDMVVHVMQPSVRAYYNLEELWQATPAQRRKQQAEQAAGE